MFNDLAYLISTSISYDDVGNTIEEETRKRVFVQKKSIRMREFYEAQSIGLKPDFVLVLADYYDYNDEKLVSYKGKTYDITRTYIVDNRIELTLTERRHGS